VARIPFVALVSDAPLSASSVIGGIHGYAALRVLHCHTWLSISLHSGNPSFDGAEAERGRVRTVWQFWVCRVLRRKQNYDLQDGKNINALAADQLALGTVYLSQAVPNFSWRSSRQYYPVSGRYDAAP